MFIIDFLGEAAKNAPGGGVHLDFRFRLCWIQPWGQGCVPGIPRGTLGSIYQLQACGRLGHERGTEMRGGEGGRVGEQKQYNL